MAFSVAGRKFLVLLGYLLCGLTAPGCGDGRGGEPCVGRQCLEDLDGGGDPDTDSDTQTTTDSETDTVPEEYVACEGVPASCDEIGDTEDAQHIGCCLVGVVYWCDDGQLDSIDCEGQGLGCGYDDVAGFMDCV